MFAHREVRAGVGTAITDRFGGASVAPYDELNLGDHVGDDPAAVATNRRLLTDAVLPGGRLASMRQVHGADVAVVGGASTGVPEADALVTTEAAVVLMVLVADCTPVLLADDQARVVAAVHVGRRGLTAGVLPAALRTMAALGAQPSRLRVTVGPGICPEHYEVPAAMRDEVAAAVPASAAATASGKPALDIRAGVLAQLDHEGVRHPTVLPECTAEAPQLFSYRRDGTTGRFAGVVWIEP